MLLNTLFILLSYLLGSIPFGLLIAKFHKIDIRKIGSKNIGATNVARALGKKYAAITFILDGLKGLTPMLIANKISPETTSFVGMAAVFGHIFPIFLKFKGGKGVSTTFLSFFALSPTIAIAIILSWVSTFILTRYSSLSALIATSMSLILSLLSHNKDLIFFASFTFVLIVFKHNQNIKRLALGKENKF